MQFKTVTAAGVALTLSLFVASSAQTAGPAGPQGPADATKTWTLGAHFTTADGGDTGDVVWNTEIDGWRGEAPGFFTDSASVLTAESGLVLTVTPDVTGPEEECACAARNVSLGLATSPEKYQYGFFEASVQLSAVEGITSSFWLQGASGEINVVDYTAGADAATVGVHCFGVQGKDDTETIASVLPNAATVDGVYGVDWSSKAVNFYKDGVLIKTVSEGDAGFECLHQPMSVIFSTEVAVKSVPAGLTAATSMTTSWFHHWESSESTTVDPTEETKDDEEKSENPNKKSGAAKAMVAQIAVTAAAGVLAALL